MKMKASKLGLMSDKGPSLVLQMVKNLPAIQEACVQSLEWEDPLEKRMATQSNLLAWIIPWTVEPSGWNMSLFGHSFFLLIYF